MVCAKKGQPVGILTADAIYTVTGDYAANNNAKLLDFVAKNVIVTRRSDREGRPEDDQRQVDQARQLIWWTWGPEDLGSARSQDLRS